MKNYRIFFTRPQKFFRSGFILWSLLIRKWFFFLWSSACKSGCQVPFKVWYNPSSFHVNNIVSNNASRVVCVWTNQLKALTLLISVSKNFKNIKYQKLHMVCMFYNRRQIFYILKSNMRKPFVQHSSKFSWSSIFLRSSAKNSQRITGSIFFASWSSMNQSPSFDFLQMTWIWYMGVRCARAFSKYALIHGMKKTTRWYTI